MKRTLYILLDLMIVQSIAGCVEGGDAVEPPSLSPVELVPEPEETKPIEPGEPGRSGASDRTQR